MKRPASDPAEVKPRVPKRLKTLNNGSSWTTCESASEAAGVGVQRKWSGESETPEQESVRPRGPRGRPVQIGVCPAWVIQSEQTVTHFREWLSSCRSRSPPAPQLQARARAQFPQAQAEAQETKFEVATASPAGEPRGGGARDADADADVAFETWPLERLAATLGQYYTEARTKSGRLYAPCTLYGIRSALALHLNGTAGPSQRRILNLASDPEFDAANRALALAVQKYKQTGIYINLYI